MIEAFWERMQIELLDGQRGTTGVALASATFEYLEVFHIVTSSQRASDGAHR
jgi:hypothetical protein